MNSLDQSVRLPEEAPDAATVSIGSDRYPATVVADDGSVLTVRYDDEVVVSGSVMDGSATYEYSSDPYGREMQFRRNAKGGFDVVILNETTGRLNKVASGHRLYVGRRVKYYDPHF